MERRAAYLGFNMTLGVGPARLRRLIDRFGSPEAAWTAPAARLISAGLDSRTVKALVAARSRLDPGAEYQRLLESEIALCTWEDADYPARLGHIHDPPPMLYRRGALTKSDEWAIAIVGTRNPTRYGREVAAKLAGELVQNGLTIVSGLALGIDTIAHQAALESGGRTIAVLGGGLRRIYPERNSALAERIVRQGVLFSEYHPDLPPLGGNFPARNRVISGLSLGVVVVEAGERSGALITAGFALEQGREVFAVPGSILSRSSMGCHRLIADGATLVGDVKDILVQLNLGQAVVQQELALIVPETDEEARLLDVLSHEPTHIDELGRVCELTAQHVAATLSLMELKGFVRQVGGMEYVRAR